jgi:hypothetical protein
MQRFEFTLAVSHNPQFTDFVISCYKEIDVFQTVNVKLEKCTTHNNTALSLL